MLLTCAITEKGWRRERVEERRATAVTTRFLLQCGAMEMFQLVDENGLPVGEAPRSECHGNPRLIHAVVHVHVRDAAGRLFLQRRALTKDTNPGKWDTSVGGHIRAGEPVERALRREAREELGINARAARPVYSYLYRSGEFETEYAFCYEMAYSGKMVLDPEEMEEGRFFAIEEVRGMIGSGLLTPMFEYEFPKLLFVLGSRESPRTPPSA